MAIVIDIPDPIRIESAALGSLTFTWVSLASFDLMEGLSRRGVDDREFVVQALHHHLTEPKLSPDALRELSEPDLFALAAAWAAHEHALHATLEEASYAADFVKAARELAPQWADDISRMAKTALEARKTYQRHIDAIIAPNARLGSAMTAALESIKRDREWIERMRPTDSLRAAAGLERIAELRSVTAGLGIERRLADVVKQFERPAFAEIVRQAEMVKQIQRERFQLADMVRQFKPPAAIADFSPLARAAMESIRIQTEMGKAYRERLALVTPKGLPLLDDLGKLSRSAESVWADWSARPAYVAAMDSFLRAAPTRQVYESSIATRAALTGEVHEPDQLAQELAIADSPVEQMLAEVAPELIEPYRGAVSALRRRGPDFVRHYSVSIRELLTQILHRLAPDDAVRGWTSKPDAFHKGRPTRRTRLRFIYRALDTEPYADFVERDIGYALALMDFLQGGTHRTDSTAAAPQNPEAQLALMQQRAEGVLALLIQAHRLH